MISESYIVTEVGQSVFTFTFDLLDPSYLTVTVDDTPEQDWTLTGEHELTFGPSVNLLVDQVVGFSRSTPIDKPLVEFSPTSSMRAFEFQRANNQLLHNLQEKDAGSSDPLQKTISGTAWDAKSLPLMNLADPTNDQDAATRAYVNAQIVSSGQLPPAGQGDVGKFLGITEGPAYGLVDGSSPSGVMTIDMASETSIYATQREGQTLTGIASSFRNYPAAAVPAGSNKVDFVANAVTVKPFFGTAPTWDNVTQRLTLPQGSVFRIAFKANARAIGENNSGFQSPSAAIVQIKTDTQVLDAMTVELGKLAIAAGDSDQVSGHINLETFVDTTTGAKEIFLVAACAAGGDITVLDTPAKLVVEEK